jgi:hypothetical protein
MFCASFERLDTVLHESLIPLTCNPIWFQAAIPDFELSEESKHGKPPLLVFVDWHLVFRLFPVLRGILNSKCKDGSGVLDLAELGDCLEAVGFEPDDEDIRFLQKHFDDDGKNISARGGNFIGMPSFLKAMDSWKWRSCLEKSMSSTGIHSTAKNS